MSKEEHKKNTMNISALRGDLGKAVGLMSRLLPGDALGRMDLVEKPAARMYPCGVDGAKKNWQKPPSLSGKAVFF